MIFIFLLLFVTSSNNLFEIFSWNKISKFILFLSYLILISILFSIKRFPLPILNFRIFTSLPVMMVLGVGGGKLLRKLILKDSLFADDDHDGLAVHFEYKTMCMAGSTCEGVGIHPSLTTRVNFIR